MSNYDDWDKPLNSDKGDKNGSCNRRVCQVPGAIWYNHSTRKYYCVECALMLNEHNHTDAIELWGHELCTLDE